MAEVRWALVVHGDPVQRAALTGLLESEGVSVRIADRADGALATLAASAPPDLIVIDVDVPHLDGWRLCRLLRSAEHRALNGVPILVVSSSLAGEEATRITAMLGANAFLQASAPAELLALTMRELVAGERQRPSRGAEELLREDMQKYRVLFEQSIDGIFLHDLDGSILDANSAAVTQSGYGREQLLRMSVFDLNVSNTRHESILQQWRSWEPSDSHIIEACHRRADGTEHPVEINTGKVLFGGRELMLAMVRDISERKQAERDKEKLEEQLRQAQKMEAVGQLAGGLAHDFNNMLCAILGNAEIALMGAAHDASTRTSIELVIEASRRAADLTRQLLAFSRRQVIEPRVIHLGELINRLHPMIARLLGEDIIVTHVAGEGSGNVRVDPGQIEQVLLNLALNARDAMPHGGQLLLETANVSFDETSCAALAGAGCGEFVMLAVSDTGVGMDHATRLRIFEPFFTTKGLGKGTGLGLATVYGIVDQCGGTIEVHSEPGYGTCFKIYLPRVLDKADAVPSAPPRAASRGEETILLVEDDDMVREVAARGLRSSGYEVLAAASAVEALQIVEHHAGHIDMLLTDVVMPHTNGRELADQLRVRLPGIKVLLTSGYTENVLGNRRMLDKNVQLIAKPYTLDALARRVRAVLDGPVPGTGGPS